MIYANVNMLHSWCVSVITIYMYKNCRSWSRRRGNFDLRLYSWNYIFHHKSSSMGNEILQNWFYSLRKESFSWKSKFITQRLLRGYAWMILYQFFFYTFLMNYRDFSVESKLIISLFQTVKLSLSISQFQKNRIFVK